ncbi:hypothetical protein [Chryseobacterium sp. SL1]|uniref:hypothetical protein n=1 Tax=Chryseobacterium sp. SL1 TaxID=2995159 RepID=UPI0022749CB1|nr:hypothetical protein [Chryseobacterium sp. SL1]MCY1660187.1 hypothetical protein [Chryseobacterium sp. SL1]
MVYLINDTTSPTYTKGFYYWDGSAWTSFSSIGDTTPDVWADNSGSTAVLSAKPVVIGNATSAATSAILDMSNVTNKGMLAPQVALTSATDQTTIASPKVGLLVYCTGTDVNFNTKGHLYWNGTEWRTLDNSTAASPSVTSVSCNSATLNPSNYTSGVNYTGTLTIPYTGGNGATYSPGSSVNVNNLTFTLQAGKLAIGSGSLTFTVAGTPNVTSPTTIPVPINPTTVPFLTSSQSCTANVGGSGTNAPGSSGSFISKGFNITSTSPSDTKFCLGDLCIRYNGNNIANDYLQVSHQTAPIFYTAWSHWGTTGNSGTEYQSGTLSTVGTWGNLYNFGGNANTEGSHTVLSVVNKTNGEATQYQIDSQIIINADSGATATPATSPGKIFIRIYQN